MAEFLLVSVTKEGTKSKVLFDTKTALDLAIDKDTENFGKLFKLLTNINLADSVLMTAAFVDSEFTLVTEYPSDNFCPFDEILAAADKFLAEGYIKNHITSLGI